MAGSPLKRAPKQGVRLADGSMIAFPYMPRVADLPRGWAFHDAEKIEHLIGLDRCDEILWWGPITDLDTLRLSFQMQVMRILLRIGLTAVLDGQLGRRAASPESRQESPDLACCEPVRRTATHAQPLEELDQRLRCFILIRLEPGDRHQIAVPTGGRIIHHSSSEIIETIRHYRPGPAFAGRVQMVSRRIAEH
jgi:hypothetical protein